MKNNKLFAAMAVMAIALFAANPTSASAEGRGDKDVDASQDFASEVANLEVNIGSWYTTDKLDPSFSSIVEQSVIFDALFEGLVRQDEQGNIVPAQASAWTVSDDGKKYVFTLRDDIFWTDGNPVLARDFVLAFQRIVDPSLDISGRPNYLLTNLKNANEILAGKKDVSELGITATDSKTLEIELEAPASYFVQILDYPSLVPVPSHILEQYGADWWKPDHFESNGPYELVSLVPEKTITMKLRDRGTYPDAPERVQFITIKDLRKAVHDIVAGRLDISWNLRKRDADWVEEFSGVQNLIVPLPMTNYLNLNTKSPKLSDRRIRQAFNLVIDRQAIADAASVPPAYTFAIPGMLTHAKGALGALHDGLNYQQRLVKARVLMQEAGYSPLNPMDIEIMVLGRESLHDAAIALRAMFSQIWVNVTVKVLEPSEVVAYFKSDKFEMSVNYWVGDYDDGMTFYALLKSDSTRNRARYYSPLYEELLKQALSEQDTAKRQWIYAKLEAVLRDDSPIIPLSHGNFRMIASTRLESTGLDPFFLVQVPRIHVKKSVRESNLSNCEKNQNEEPC